MSIFRNLINTLNTSIIYGIALLLPIIFTPLTTEFYDTAKFFLMATATLLILLLWGIKSLSENRINIVKTPIDLLLLLYLIVAVVSTVLSPSFNTSLFGLLPRVHGSLLFQVTLVLSFFMVVSNLRGTKAIFTVINLMVISGVVLALVSLMSYFGLFFPWPPAQTTSFSLAGTSAAAAIYLAILLPIVLTNLIRSFTNKNALSIFYFFALTLFTLTIILIGNIASWVGGILATGIFLYQTRLGLSILQLDSSRRRLKFEGVTGLLVIVVFLTVSAAILSYTPTLKNTTPLGTFASNFQREIHLPLPISWKISASAFRDSPILGTGPATYLYNVTSYKPIEYNQTPFWNLRLSTAHNQYLQTWAEMGGAGVLLLILIAAVFTLFALKYRDEWGLGLAGITFLVMMALYPSTVLTQISGFFVMALFMVELRGKGTHELSIDLSGRTASEAKGTHILVPSLIILPVLILIAVGFSYLAKLAVGEYHHRVALNAVRANRGLNAYNSLVLAERANSQIDLYRLDLAQTNFALANAIAAQKGPTEASPSGSLTDQDRRNIQQLLQQAIAEGRAATALSPRSAGNWEVLALIYRQISGVTQNALQFSLDAYGRAIQRDPLNPLLRLAVGGVYYQAKNYDLAVRFFDDAVSLKPDYPNSLYNLAIALREKGNLTEAVSVAERLVATLQDKPESQDYQTASRLLSELKSSSNKTATAQPPAATPSAALEREGLPNVVDIGQPDQIATPPAVPR